MPIKVFCDRCGKQIDKADGFGQFSNYEKVLLFNVKAGQQSPQIKEEEYYLCSECGKEIIKLIKNENK